MNVFAYTPSDGASHPPYISLNEDDAGKITLSAREGPADNFRLVNINLPFEEVVAMHRELGIFIERRQAR